MNNQHTKTFRVQAFAFRSEVDQEPEFADKNWEVLEQAVHQIYNSNVVGLNFEEAYRIAYSMVLHKHGEKLYSGLVTTTTAHLKEISESIEASQEDSFLQELSTKWTNYNKALNTIRDVFMYMDRTFIPITHKTPIYELGLKLWRDNVIHSSNIQSRLLNTLLESIRQERTGEVINRGLMRNIITMLIDLGGFVYQEEFEKPFLEASGNFYRVESQQLIECCDCADYLKRVETHLNEEIERVSNYLDPKSEPKIANVVETEMIAKHMLRLVHMENSGLINMLENDKYEDLGRMYNLFSWVTNGLSTIRDVMTCHIRETCTQLIGDREMVKDRVEFVRSLSDEKDRYYKIVSLAFNNDEIFQNALNSSYLNSLSI